MTFLLLYSIINVISGLVLIIVLTIILWISLYGIETLYDMLYDDLKEDAVILHGKVKKADREQALDDMRNKKKHILLATYQLAKEGLDVPCLDRLLLATPVQDCAIVVQSSL